MENASKALIIAGAILLSILLITLGVVVVSNVMPTINRANVNQQEVQTFNAKFDSFGGSNKTATDVRSLYAAVISSNGSEKINATGREVKVSYKGETAAAPTSYPTDLSNGEKYKIELKVDQNTGYINEIDITV